MALNDSRRRALVTGASSGLGAALALRLASEGFETWLAARRIDPMAHTVDEIRKRGGFAHALSVDVTDAERARSRFTELDRANDGFDLVIAAAGVAGSAAIGRFIADDWTKLASLVQTNLLGVMATLQPFARGMAERGHGHLVGISSLSAWAPLAGAATYGATKAGLSHLLEALAVELRPYGVRVTCVEPGFISTPATASMPSTPGRVSAEVAAEKIVAAVLRQRRAIRFPASLAAVLRVLATMPAPVRRALLPAADEGANQ